MADFNKTVVEVKNLLNEYVKRDSAIHAKSSWSNKTLWRALVTYDVNKQSAFMVVYHDRGTTYFYRCYLG